MMHLSSSRQGLSTISSQSLGAEPLISKVTSWLKTYQIFGMYLSVSIHGYRRDFMPWSTPDMTATFRCSDDNGGDGLQNQQVAPPVSSLPSSVCHDGLDS